MKMYKLNSWDTEVKEFEVEKKTAKTLWYYRTRLFDKKKSSKLTQERIITDYHRWFNSEKDANDFLIAKYKIKLSMYQDQVINCENLIKRLKLRNDN